MRPELGYEVRMRILFAFLSGIFAMEVLTSLAIKLSNSGVIGFGIAAVVFMFAATTNRWLIKTDR